MMWILVAAQLTAPVPVNRSDWFTQADIPVEQLTIGTPVVVPYRVTVGPDGVVQDCQAEVSGIEQVDVLTCTLVTRRAAFEPATDGRGQPVQGVYRSFKRWLITDGRPPQDAVIRPDIELSVAQLPAGVQAPAVMNQSVSVDENGRAVSCNADGSRGHPALVKAGCDELKKLWHPSPARTAAGQPVASVQNAVVLFIKG